MSSGTQPSSAPERQGATAWALPGCPQEPPWQGTGVGTRNAVRNGGISATGPDALTTLSSDGEGPRGAYRQGGQQLQWGRGRSCRRTHQPLGYLRQQGNSSSTQAHINSAESLPKPPTLQIPEDSGFGRQSAPLTKLPIPQRPTRDITHSGRHFPWPGGVRCTPGWAWDSFKGICFHFHWPVPRSQNLTSYRQNHNMLKLLPDQTIPHPELGSPRQSLGPQSALHRATGGFRVRMGVDCIQACWQISLE